MISKGANSWNLALEKACHGGHLEIVKLMITKGADISKLSVQLSKSSMKLCDDDVFYLLQAGVKQFGKYQNIAKSLLEWTKVYTEKLSALLYRDIINIVSKY